MIMYQTGVITIMRNLLFKYENKIYLFLIPSLVGISLFYVAPFFISIYYVVIDNAVSRQFVGIYNLIDTWNNQAFAIGARNTVVFMSTSIPLNMGIALMFALMLKPLNPAIRRLLAIFFLVPLVIPSGSVTFFWDRLLAINGMINRHWLPHFGEEPINWLHSEYAMVFIVMIFVWKNIGFNMILFQAGLDSIPKDYYEFAAIEGAGKLRQFFIVTLTYLQPTFLLVFILSVVNSFKVFREIYLLTGTHPSLSIYLLQHFMNNQFANLNYQRMASASFFLFIFIFAIVIALYRLQQRQTYW